MKRSMALGFTLALGGCGSAPAPVQKPGVPLSGKPALHHLVWHADTLYATGTTREALVLGRDPVVAVGGAVVYALDRNYNPKWMAGFGHTTVRSLATGPAGDLWFVGDFSGAFGGGGRLMKSAGQRDCVVGRVSPQGDVRWATKIGGPGEDTCGALVVDSSGAWLGGQFEQFLVSPKLSAEGPADGFVARVDRDGGLLGGWRVGGPGAETVDALAIAGSTVAVAGTFDQDFKVRFTPLLTPVGGAGAFVMGLGVDGKPTWARVLGHQPDTRPHALVPTVAGGWAVAGEAQGAAFVEGLDKGGVRRWRHDLKGWSHANRLVRDGSDLVVAGAAKGAALGRLSAAGDLLEQFRCGGGADRATGVAVSPAGDAWWVGDLTSAADCADAGGVIVRWGR